jgi:molybdopterin-guanine dinucleotide biosynthesis protein MobB
MKLLGLCIGVIRQSHRDVSNPENDSLELKKAGANQVIIASDTQYTAATSPGFLVEQLDLKNIDIVMLDGFDHFPFAKIELHRSSMGDKLIYPQDKSVIAVAADEYLETEGLPLLNIDLPKEVAGYINRWSRSHPQAAQSASAKTNG